MAEEFADFIKELNKKSLEEQVTELKLITSKLVNITEKFIKHYDMEITTIYNKIIKIETNQIRAKLPKIKVLATPAPPPPLQSRPIGDNGIRKTILNELKDLFNKENKNIKKR